MNQEKKAGQEEEKYLKETLAVINDNVRNYEKEVSAMQASIDEMLERYHDNDVELYTILSNTITLHDHMKRALERNEKAKNKPYFGRIVFHDDTLDKEESIYIGKGGISKDTTHWMVTDWRAPAANVYYENGLGKCSYHAPDNVEIPIDLKLKRTYEIEDGRLLDFFDTEVVANDDLLTKYLAKNKQAVLGEIIATIQKEQNEIIRKSPYHNIIVQGVAGSGKTTVAMHRISYILYNYKERFKPDDFYIIGSNRILLNYITGVLPDLDVYGVRQMTMEQLFVRLLYEEWDEKKYRIKPLDKMSTQSNRKGTLQWFQDLEEYCRNLEWELIPRESVFLKKKILLSSDAVERYIKENPAISMQSKINMLNERLITKIKDEFLGKGISYTEEERKSILKSYRGWYNRKGQKKSIYSIYHDFLLKQFAADQTADFPDTEFDIYDLAALAYLYKRIKETEVISEAHHVVIDEAQDFGMMAYCVLNFCIKDCTYTVMGDTSQNIHFGYGLNDWESLKVLLLTDSMDSFGVLKKSYRNTIEISEFATQILRHGKFPIYPVEPIIRHGTPVQLLEIKENEAFYKKAASICESWQKKGLDTIAIVCRNYEHAKKAAKELKHYIEIMDCDLEKAVFGSGIMVLPVEYTKGLEFDAVLILNPTREYYPVDDGHAKLLYVAATRALHELCVLYRDDLTGLIADPVPDDNIIETAEHAIPPASATSTAATKASFSEPVNIKPSGRKKIVIARPKETPKPIPQTLSQMPQSVSQESIRENTKQNKLQPTSEIQIAFGDMPPTEKLRPAGHAKIDLAVRWAAKQDDGLYLQSRYGLLRISPVGSAIIRITFAKGQEQPIRETNPKIDVHHIDNRWMYRESGGNIELTTDELCLQINKLTGAIRYLTRDKKLLLAERSKECRQLESVMNGTCKTWLFLDWQKGETLYGIGTQGNANINLRGTAKYFSHGKQSDELPFLLSDKGYGILIPTDNPVMCCDISTYGSYLHTENESQIDYYFIAGKQANTILNAYAYLCGKM